MRGDVMLDLVQNLPEQHLPALGKQPMAAAVWITIPIFSAGSMLFSASEVFVSRSNVAIETIVPTSDLLLGDLARHYTLRNRDAVIAFLERHPEQGRLVLEAYTHIQAFFPGAEVSLEVDTDDDPSGQRRRLVVAIMTEVDAHEAVTRLRAFDFEWWLAQPASKTDLLLFTLE